MASYTPGGFAGRLLLLRPDGPSDAAPAWRRVAAQVDVHTVPGDHFTLLQPPHVQEVAAAITARLREP